MNTYTPQFYDLLSRAFLGDVTSARLQAFLDDVMAEKYNTLQLDGFNWASDLQLDFTYEQLQREKGITAMANYYDLDSPAIPRETEGITINTGKIPRMKDVIYINEDKARKMMLMEKVLGDANATAIQAGEALFETVDQLIGGHTNSLTYQRHQMVSKRALTLTDKNNPKGISGVTFSAGVPKSNITKLTGANKFWTDTTYATEGSSADPINAIADWLEPILDKGIVGHIEINKAYFRRILRHSAVIKAIGYSMFPTSSADVAFGAANVLSLEDRQAKFEALIGVPVKVIDSIVSVARFDKTAKSIVKENTNAFEKDVIVFVPDGNIGEVLAVLPYSVPDPSAVVSTFYGGRLQLTVAADAVKKCQSFSTEMTALAVPNCPQYMYYLHPNED